MSDPTNTLYDADPHTVAKHQILREYLKRWLPILGQGTKRRLLYVDGFAGPGQYTKQEPGSPLVAIDAALEHPKDFGKLEVVLIEKRQDRVDHLARLVAEKRKEPKTLGRLELRDPIAGDCMEEVKKLLADFERRKEQVGPAFFFLDQFGYSSFSMDFVGRILKHSHCEVFSYLNWQRLMPYMDDKGKHRAISEAFSGDEWRALLSLSGQQKKDKFRDVYLDALRTRGGATYVLPFEMRDTNDQVIYWLFFSTNNIRGLEEMKEAMWKVDKSGGFVFSDRHNNSPPMYSFSDANLANDLSESFDGQTVQISALRLHTLIATPAYNWKAALKVMETSERLKVLNSPPKRRMGTFNDLEMTVKIKRDGKSKPTSLFDDLGD